MVDVGGIVAILGAGAGLGWVGNIFTASMQTRSARADREARAELDLAGHRDALMFQVLGAAKEQLSQLHQELARLRPLESHLLHFEEALRHIENLMLPMTDEERKITEREAKSFIRRMRNIQSAEGTARNEIARLDASLRSKLGDDEEISG